MKRILLTTDFSDESKHAFATTVEIATGMGMGITLAHVVLDVRSIPQGAPLAPPVSSPEVSEEIAEARASIAVFAKELGNSVDVKTEVLTGEHVAKTLADYANDNDIAFIAISTNGRTGLRHFILGSVAEEVVRHSPVPVVTFPPMPAAE